MNSKIKKTIIRKIKTADFESIDIAEEIEQEIEWKTDKERVEKEDKVFRALLDAFKKDLVLTMTELGLDKCIGSVTVKEGTQPKKKSNKKSSFDEDDDFGIDFLGDND